ncbi:DUF1850 domain-containing protein [Moraxella oblonga]|uniref:DUF1850 domain-containing protein n=1 Tax=Moraxella oblonga TaxID=200413 RepID=UPI000A00826C|nr:DUF1850 domain-containing protein [Moraxella oblonga]
MMRVFGIFVIIIGLSVVGLHSQSRLLITTDTWRCKWATDSFVLQWRHSVEKQLWQEYYQKDKHSLLLTHSYVQSFGAGVPTTNTIIPAPDGFVGMKHDLVIPKLSWVVSARMQGTVIEPVSQQRLEVYRHVDDYTVVNIQVERQPAIWWWQINACENMFNQTQSS